MPNSDEPISLDPVTDQLIVLRARTDDRHNDIIDRLDAGETASRITNKPAWALLFAALAEIVKLLREIKSQ